MHVVVYSPETNEILLSRELGDDEIMDEIIFAREVADSLGQIVDESDNGYIPNCSGDIRVEFRRDPGNDVCIYSGESFYFLMEDY